jgi:hypothetical protein
MTWAEIFNKLKSYRRRHGARRPAPWPGGYFNQVFGGWEGGPPRRESGGEYEQRPGIE